MTTAELKDSTPTFQADRHLIAGRYETQARIGRGRLGEIFAAVDKGYEELGVEQQLAIQVIPDNVVNNNQLFNKINLGYTILRAAAHPNIVNYKHFGRDGKFGFIVMELLDGLSLRSVLDGAEVLTLDEAKPVIRGIGEALRLLHTKNMVHGNLTTRNVFITEEFKVRLLDVLPLDASEAIMRGIATSEPFGRCTVVDDVFGLACLTYEMLAGKHPFNYSTPAEASLAGLEADRIASLSDDEWKALRRALSFDRHERTSSIADFMYEFGISGVERLQPAMDRPARQESIVYPAEEATPPTTRPAIKAKSAATATPVVTINPVSRNENWVPLPQPVARRVHPARAVFLGMLLAGISTWYFYGQPQEQAVNLIGYIDETFNVGLVEQYAPVEISTLTSDRSVAMEPVAPVEQPAVVEPAATVVTMPADLDAPQPEPVPTASIEENVSAVAQTPVQPVPLYPVNSRDATVTGTEVTNLIADEVLADADVEPIQTKPELIFSESVVLTSERDGAARITPPRIENSATPLIWWTSENTATADKDFVSVEQRIVGNASIEGDNILLVPLVNDNLPEPQESFFVNFGLRNSQLGRIERIATVRVNISDDDFR